MINLYGNSKDEEISKYNVIVENEDGYVFYNQISGALILLDKKDFSDYRKLLKGNFYVNSHLLKVLRENGMIKKRSFDEMSFMEKKYNKCKNKSFNKQVTIVPTDKCNLGCVYCYEEKSQWKNMSPEVIEQTKKFIEIFVLSSPTNVLSITWFGGEPTLNLSCIENIVKYLKAICDKNKIKLTQYMVSNGTNINEKVIARLKKIGLNSLQVTVDGFKEDHDKSRPFLSSMNIDEMSDIQIAQRRKTQPSFGRQLNILGQEPQIKKQRSSYDAIIKNLVLMHQEGFRVSLRCNINSRNIKNYHKLLSHLEDLNLLAPHESGGIVNPYVSQVFDHESNQNLRDMDRETFSEFEMTLKEKYSGHTSATLNIEPFSGESCTANKLYSFCISQSGKLTKCWHHVSNEKYVIGDIWDLELAKQGSVDDFSPFKDEECRKCHILPICLGGCKEGNGFYEERYDRDKYHGCATFRWNIRSRVNLLYVQNKNGIKNNSNSEFKIDIN